MDKPNSDKWYIIANPAAGNQAVKKHLPKILHTLNQHQFEFEWVATTHRNHAAQLVTQGIQKGYRKIIAIGGDGTNNEVVNGIILQTEISTQEITYCLLPIGTGNDWIKAHRIPKDLNLWISMIKKGKILLQDIGLVRYSLNGKKQQRYFVNVAGMAYDAFICDEMEKLKRPLTNRLTYLFFSLYFVFKYKLQKAKVHFNNKTVEGYFYLINAGICKYSGGGMQLVPHAIPNDGKLALTLVGKLSKLEVLLNAYRFYGGKITDHSKVSIYQTDHIIVEALGNPIGVEVDGEWLGETPVEFSLIPKALKVIVP